MAWYVSHVALARTAYDAQAPSAGASPCQRWKRESALGERWLESGGEREMCPQEHLPGGKLGAGVQELEKGAAGISSTSWSREHWNAAEL